LIPAPHADRSAQIVAAATYRDCRNAYDIKRAVLAIDSEAPAGCPNVPRL
jgi:hypothetical protein